MKSYFMSLKMNGTYCILWSFLLYAVCSTGLTDGCPARCSCDVKTCKNVYCQWRGLENVPTGIPNDTCYLDLDGNQISRIDRNAFQGLLQLKTLDLSYNQISRIDRNVFQELSQLQTLLLWGNNISKIDSNAFDGLSQLQRLYLYYNQISMIDSNAFEGLSQLQKLILSSNQISQIEVNAFQGLSQLRELDLERNQINRIDSKTFEGLLQLRTLFIYRNPFECYCDLEPFAVFVRTKRLVLGYGSEQPKCNSPSNLKGVQILDVPFHNMSCSTTYETTIPIQMTTDFESKKHTVHSIPMKNDQHTTGLFLVRSFLITFFYVTNNHERGACILCRKLKEYIHKEDQIMIIRIVVASVLL